MPQATSGTYGKPSCLAGSQTAASWWAVMLLLLGTTVISIATHSAQAAQPDARSDAHLDTRWARDTTHIVATLTLPTDTRVLVVEGPADASIRDVELLRYGAEAIPLDAEARPTTWTLRFSAPQQGPFEAVVRVRTGAPTMNATWRFIPFTGTDLAAAALTRVSYTVETPPAGQQTWAWPFTPEVRPGATSRRAAGESEGPLAPGHTPEAFTIAFWMRTMQRRAVIASTWTGAPGASYPLELVVGPAGRMQAYQGTGTVHHVMRTGAMVADGRWHHVAVTYAPRTRRTMVFVDGEGVAEQRTPARSAAEAPLAFGQRPLPPTSDRANVETAPDAFVGQLAWVQVIPDALEDDLLRGLRNSGSPHEGRARWGLGPWQMARLHPTRPCRRRSRWPRRARFRTGRLRCVEAR